MRDVIIVGLVGLVQELVLADKREAITGVLFGLLVISAITRTTRWSSCANGVVGRLVPVVRRAISASISMRGITEMPFALAAATSGLPDSTAVEVTTT